LYYTLEMSRQAWLAHVKAYRVENPSLSWREALDAARESYKGPEAKPRKENKWLVHVMAVKTENPTVSFKEVLKLAKTSYHTDSTVPPVPPTETVDMS